MSDIQKKFEEWVKGFTETFFCGYVKGDLIQKAYQAAYQQALDDVVEMLGSDEAEEVTKRAVFPYIPNKEHWAYAAKLALTAIKQKVKGM